MLARRSMEQCALCLRIGHRGFNAAYSVLDVRACKKHLAKVIDAASRLSIREATDRPVHNYLTSLSSLGQVRKIRESTLRQNLKLENSGILDIRDDHDGLPDNQ